MNDTSLNTCRLIIDPPQCAYYNMAADESLFRFINKSDFPAALRIYGWSPAALSLGRRQKLDEIDPEACREQGVDVVRRLSGGGAVYHADEVTYCFAIRLDKVSLPRAQVWRELFCGLLESLGLKADAGSNAKLKKSRGKPFASTACFSHAEDDEPTVKGRKWLGSSRKKSRDAYMQHGSILLGRQPQFVSRLLTNAEKDISLGLREMKPGLSVPDIQSALASSVEKTLGVRLVKSGYTKEEAMSIEKLEKLKRDEWESSLQAVLSGC